MGRQMARSCPICTRSSSIKHYICYKSIPLPHPIDPQPNGMRAEYANSSIASDDCKSKSLDCGKTFEGLLTQPLFISEGVGMGVRSLRARTAPIAPPPLG